MEVNDFMDLNTTELFDDSNDSFDENEEGDNSETNVSDDGNLRTTYSSDGERNASVTDDNHLADAGTISTDVILGTKPATTIEEVRLLNSMRVPTAVITPTIPSGLSITQKCTKSQSTSDVTFGVNVTPTTVISKSIGIHEANNMECPTEPTIISMRPKVAHKLTTALNKSQLNSMAKYGKLHSALVSSGHTAMESNTIHNSAKLVKIAPSGTSLTAIATTTPNNVTADIKTSPVIIVQTPTQKLGPIGQKFTSLKILQKCPTPGTIVKQKILNLNEMRKLNSGGSLKPLILNAASSGNTISTTDTNVGYLQSTPSLIVLKPPVTSTTSAATSQTSTTIQLKPQQLYQTMSSTNATKPTTISFVTTTKPSSISIGKKLIPSKILTTVKPNTSTDSIVTQLALPVGLTKIPKETIVNKIATKDAHGGIDFMRMLKAKQSEKSIEPTVTIGQKQMSNKPPMEFQSLTNFLNSNEKPKSLDISNGKVVDKMDEPSSTTTTGRGNVESIVISNGKLSNPNGSIKILKSVAESNDDVVPEDGICLNKHLTQLNTSPRLQGRSKSLTIAKQQSKVRRRYPSAGNAIASEKLNENVGVEETFLTKQGDSETKTAKPETIEEIDEAIEVKSIEDTVDGEQTKCVGDSLACDENIDDSDKSKSVSPDVPLVSARQINVAASVTATNPLPTSVSSSHVDQKNDDPLTYIKWRNGVGHLKFSKLQFSKNEFNLLEVFEIKESAKSNTGKMMTIKATEQPDQIIDLVERKSDASDRSSGSSAIGRKKVESKQRFKRAGMNLLQNVFVWELYLRLMDAQAAPDNLFINPFPSSPNPFEVGMKMEAIDPEHCSLFCVCTVVEKLGYRIRLTFDGYGDKFSFWRNADSMDIFPPGWCAKTGRVLQPPLKYGSEPFDWHRYILKTNGKFAPRSNFTHLNSMTTRNPFKVGMKLEADHLKLGRGKVGVATICDVLDNRILLQFDGFDSTHDYWADITSPNIHPCNWHKSRNRRLTISIKDDERNFSWPHYLAATRSQPVSKEFFCTRPAFGFRDGMKLEIVDKKVPTLIRPCTVIKVADYNIQVLFDGWPSTYSYWIDDDHPDIHPINWCLKTEHPLEPPLNFGQEEFRSACGVLGCREVGNAKHFGVGFHYTIFECPYESRNWLSNDTKLDRLAEINKMQKVRKRRARQPLTSGTESYQKIKLELPSSEENSLQNPPPEWNALPKIKSEEMEIGEAKLQSTSMPATTTTTDNSPNKLIPRHIQVTESILRDYAPGLMRIHKLWTQNSKSLNIRRIAKNPLCWSVDEVADYVSRLPNCSKLGKLFREQEIDGDSFLKLCQNDLVDVLEIRMGPAVKIYNQIVALRSDVCENYMDTD